MHLIFYLIFIQYTIKLYESEANLPFCLFCFLNTSSFPTPKYNRLYALCSFHLHRPPSPLSILYQNPLSSQFLLSYSKGYSFLSYLHSSFLHSVLIFFSEVKYKAFLCLLFRLTSVLSTSSIIIGFFHMSSTTPLSYILLVFIAHINLAHITIIRVVIGVQSKLF